MSTEKLLKTCFITRICRKEGQESVRFEKHNKPFEKRLKLLAFATKAVFYYSLLDCSQSANCLFKDLM